MLFNRTDLRRKRLPQIFVQRLVSLRVFELVSLREAPGEVHHGLYRHPALDALVAAVQLGIGLLNQRHPELSGVRAPGVAVGAILLRQPEHSVTGDSDSHHSPVIDADCDPVSVPPEAEPDQAGVAGPVERLPGLQHAVQQPLLLGQSRARGQQPAVAQHALSTRVS